MGNVTSYRTKLSIYKQKQAITSINTLTPFSAGLSYKTGYEIYKIIDASIPQSLSSVNWFSIDYGYHVSVLVSTDIIAVCKLPYIFTPQTITGEWKDISYGIHSQTWIAIGTNVVAFATAGFESALFS